MHTLENAIVLLKQEMEPVEKAAAMMALIRLVNSLWADMMAGWEDQEAIRPRAMAALAAARMLPIPAEAFADAGILHDNLRVVSVDGAVLVVSDDRKTKWAAELDKSLEQLGIDRAGFEKLVKAVMEPDEDEGDD